MELTDILSDTISLHTLCNQAPDLWQKVLLNLKSHVEKAETHKLALLRSDAKALLQEWINSPAGMTPEPKIPVQKLVQAKMTILAIDQFANVITGQVGTRPSLKDRVIVSYGLLSRIKRRAIFKERSFDRIWNLVHNKSWAAGEIQRHGFWSIPTAEFMERIAFQAQSRNILEIAAGHGYLAAGLRLRGCSVTAIDNFSWSQTETQLKEGPMHPGVLKVGATEALAQHQAPVVICSWPPPANTFEEDIFNTKSVQLYIAIVSKHKFASGNWSVYQSQKKFAASVSEPLNKMLRPVEADQQVLIFRRI